MLLHFHDDLVGLPYSALCSLSLPKSLLIGQSTKMIIWSSVHMTPHSLSGGSPHRVAQQKLWTATPNTVHSPVRRHGDCCGEVASLQMPADPVETILLLLHPPSHPRRCSSSLRLQLNKAPEEGGGSSHLATASFVEERRHRTSRWRRSFPGDDEAATWHRHRSIRDPSLPGKQLTSWCCQWMLTVLASWWTVVGCAVGKQFVSRRQSTTSCSSQGLSISSARNLTLQNLILLGSFVICSLTVLWSGNRWTRWQVEPDWASLRSRTGRRRCARTSTAWLFRPPTAPAPSSEPQGTDQWRIKCRRGSPESWEASFRPSRHLWRSRGSENRNASPRINLVVCLLHDAISVASLFWEFKPCLRLFT